MGYNIAIDGPAGAGKSTIAKLVAKETRIHLCRYRSDVPWNGNLFSGERIFRRKDSRRRSQQTAKNVKVTIGYEEGGQQVYLNGEEYHREIKRQKQ